MKIYLSVFLTAFILFSSCSGSKKLKRDYQRTGHQFTSNLTFDQTWEKVIDYFHLTATPIHTIDKASGIVIAQNVSFMKGYTFEKTFSRDKKAFVALPKIGNLSPIKITGTINVRVKQDGTVTAGIYNLLAESQKQEDPRLKYYPDVASTGKFERELEAFIKAE